MNSDIPDEARLVDHLSTYYDLGRVEIEAQLETQGRREAYRVRGERGRYVLKLTDPGRSETALRGDVGTFQYLSALGFPAPRPLPERDGRLYRAFKERFIYLYEYIEGSHPRPGPGFYRCLGSLLARLHSLPPGGDVPRSGYRPEEVLPGVRTALASISRPDQRAVAEELLAMAASFPSFGDVPEGIQHSDPYFVNLIEDPRGTLHLIDWDDGGLAYPLLDVAYVLAHLCTFTARDRRVWGIPGPEQGLVWRPDWAEEFLATYQAGRPLAESERALLPAAIRLSFLVYIPNWEEGSLIMDNYYRMKMVDWDRLEIPDPRPAG